MSQINIKDWIRQAFSLRTKCNNIGIQDEGKKIFITGWIFRYRDQGGCLFIDLRDKSGLVQLVFDASQMTKETFEIAESLRNEYVIVAEGIVVRRSQENINAKISTGAIEVHVSQLSILNEAKTPAFSLEEYSESNEEIRLRYRFLDIRRPQMQEILEKRSLLNYHITKFFTERQFLNIETPILNRATPEGARDFLVPSRLNEGLFYALPQSPQIFKQTLMASGCEKYFQIAKCFRDEDLRSDRQPEFTQLDIEMSFVTEDMIINIMEELWREVVSSCFGIQISTPFPRITYKEAIEKYGKDTPDLRFDVPLICVADIVAKGEFSIFNKTLQKKGNRIKAICVPGGAKLSHKDIENLTNWVQKDYGARGLAWMKHEKDGLKSVISKFFSPEILQELCLACNSKEGDIIFFGAGDEAVVHATLGNLRTKLADTMNLIDMSVNKWNFVWVLDFPLFEYDKDKKFIKSVHNPFTSPTEEHISHLFQEQSPEESIKIQSRAYDLVLNGVEIGGGSIRMHDPKLQKKVFEKLGISPAQMKQQFGFFLDTLACGTPPHGGIAFGLDRILMLFLELESIREVIAFPKTQKGQCLFSQAPNEVNWEQLRELHLKIDKK